MNVEDIEQIVNALIDVGETKAKVYFSEIVNGGEQFSPLEGHIRITGPDEVSIVLKRT